MELTIVQEDWRVFGYPLHGQQAGQSADMEEGNSEKEDASNIDCPNNQQIKALPQCIVNWITMMTGPEIACLNIAPVSSRQAKDKVFKAFFHGFIGTTCMVKMRL